MVLVGGLPTLGDLTWVVGEALAGGADVIQYREKGVPDREFLMRARELRILTAQARVPLIVNDRVDLARLASCDGVHVGQADLRCATRRRIMGATAHIGVSTHDRAQLDAAILAGASYLGVGPVFPSPTKTSPSRSWPAWPLSVSPPRRPRCPGSRSAGSTKKTSTVCSKRARRGSP